MTGQNEGPTEGNWRLSRRAFARLLGVSGLIGSGTTARTAAGESGVRQVGEGAYRTDIPSAATEPPRPKYTTENVSRPYPTNDWWTRLLTVEHAEPLFSHPVVTEPTEAGLSVGYTDAWEVGDGTGVDMRSNPVTPSMEMAETAYMPFQPDFVVRPPAVGAFDRSLVDDYGDWHVSYRMEAADGSMTVTQARGSPYLYLASDDSGVEFDFESEPTVFAEQESVLGVTVGGTHYGLFGPAGSTWSKRGEETIENDLADAGSATIALLPEDTPSTLERFAEYAHNVLTDTRIDWEYVDRENGEVVSEVRTTFEFSVTDRRESGGDETVTALYPHQHKYLHEDTRVIEGLGYDSPRGRMKLTAGSSFTTALPYPGIVPNFPAVDSADRSTVEQYAKAVSTPVTGSGRFGASLAREFDVPTLAEADVAWSRLPFVPGKSAPTGGSYWTGLNFNRWAEAVAVLDQYGYTDRRDLVLAAMKETCGEWFDPETNSTREATDSQFFYDDNWGTLVGHPSGFDTYEGLNDHHFHLGYYLRAAATIGRYSEEWAEASNYGDIVNLLVREYASPTREDDMFPFLRCFSPYAGHSYASGVNPFRLGNNQESSSEAINAYASLIRWGAFTGHQLDGTPIEELGIFLYTHEVHAALEYWYDWDRETHPENWERAYASVVWDGGYAHSTWWTEDDQDTYAINVIPAAGHSLYLGWDREHTGRIYDELVGLTGGEQFRKWPGLLLEFGGFADPSHSLDRFEEWESGAFPAGDGYYVPDISNSKLHTYTMLTALAELGSPTREVVSDATFSQVFVDESGNRSYLVYNPDTAPKTVAFSDGSQFQVDPDTLRVVDGSPDTAERSNVAGDGTESTGDGADRSGPTTESSEGPADGLPWRVLAGALGALGLGGAGYLYKRDRSSGSESPESR